MGVKKNRLKRGLVLALTLALVGNGMSSTMLTALAEENEPEVTNVQDTSKEPRVEKSEDKGDGQDTGAATEDKTSALDGTDETKNDGNKNKTLKTGSAENKSDSISEKKANEIVTGEVLDLGGIETSAETISLFSLDSSGKVSLTAGNHERWIDRIDVPEYAKTLYNTLVEGADNDGVEDILIDDSYYSREKVEDINKVLYNAIPITTMTGNDSDVLISQFLEAGKYVRAVYDAFDRDHPEVFWLTGANQIATRLTGKKDPSGNWEYTSEIYFILKGYKTDEEFDVRKDNYQTAASIKADIKVRDERVRTILDSAPAGDTYDKVTYFNDWLTKNNEYNTDVTNAEDSYLAAWECTSALAGNVGTKGPVCEGYARAFKVLCDKSGIPCVLADGHARNSQGSAGEAHMWNNVKVDGSWYAIDVTWNDPTGGKQGAVSGLENEEWSLVGAKTEVRGMTFESSHPVANKASQEGQDFSGGTAFLNGPVLNDIKYDGAKPVPVVSFASQSITTTYDGGEASFDPPTVTLSGKPVTGAEITYSYKASGDNEFRSGRPVNAGTYIIKARVASTDTYRAAEAETNLIIAKKGMTIKAKDQEIAYGESIKKGTDQVEGSGLAESDLISEVSLSTDGKNVGSYPITPSVAVIKRDGMNVTGNYDITYQNGTLTINKATKYTVDVMTEQNVLNGSGKFIEPSFKGVEGEIVEGKISYAYNGTEMDYGTLVAALSGLVVGNKVSVTYSFTPEANGNYTGLNTGAINFTIKDIEFTVDDKPAAVNNAVTIKSNPVYGEQWSDIVKINPTITAKAGNKIDNNPEHFKLSVSGMPDAGEQPFKVLYNGTIDGKSYTNAVVCEGTASIAQCTLEVLAGDYKVTKVYDGTTDSTNVKKEGNLKVDGILKDDTDVKVNGTLGIFESPNAGTGKMTVELALTGERSSNYRLNNNRVEVTCTITPRPLTPIISVEGSYTYNGDAVIPAIKVTDTNIVDGESGILDAKYYDISCSNNVNAGQATVTVSPKENGNYTWQSVSKEFTIAKAEYSAPSVSHATRYGNADTYDLASLLPEGAKLGTITFEDDNDIFEKDPSVNGTILSYTLSADSNKIGQEAAITVLVTETKNYNPFNITITVTVSAKLQQDNFKFDLSSSEVKKTYGDGDFTVAVQGAAEGSTVSYESNNTSVATVDAASGSVHILRQGTAAITATASETDDYISKSVTYTLTVTPKALTWDVSGLQAVNKQGTIDKDKKAALYGELRVSGILSADNGKVSYSCPAEKLTGIYADTKPGAQKVTLNWSGEPAVLEGTDVDNYTLPGALPEITGRINAVTEQTNVPESTDTVKYKLEVEDGISQVPATLKENLDLNTPAKIEEKMKTEIRISLKEESNQNSIEVYDVVLMVKDGDGEWKVASEENFPKDGLTVTLPYPEGTGKNTHNFEIAHMFTHDMRGHKPGEIERPTASKLDEGIQFKVTSLSPVAIGWKEIKADNNGANGNTNTAATAPNKSRSPQTGDENAVMLYVLLMLLGAAGVGFTMRRKAIR